MKFNLEKEHSHFFSENGFIILEGLFEGKSLASSKSAVKHSLARRLKQSTLGIESTSPETLFLEGRDLWKDEPELFPVIKRRSLNEVVYELMHEKPFRLALTDYLPSYDDRNGTLSFPILNKLTERPFSLTEMSSIQGMIGGVIVCLESEEEDANAFLPTKAGQGLFFTAERSIDLSSLRSEVKRSYLLVAYAKEAAVYVRQVEDFHAHSLKKYGYVYGDKLLHKHHPLLFR